MFIAHQASKSGKTSLVFPLDAFLKLTTGAMCIIIGVLSLIIWAVMLSWNAIAWGIFIAAILIKLTNRFYWERK